MNTIRMVVKTRDHRGTRTIDVLEIDREIDDKDRLIAEAQTFTIAHMERNHPSEDAFVISYEFPRGRP